MAAMGRPQYINIRLNKSPEFHIESLKAKGMQILDAAYDAGIRYYDTAPGYGMAEELLLEWVKTKKDTSIEIATKWGYAYVANFNPEATIHELKEHSLKQLDKQWEFSKELLPYLSTLQIHSATFETGVLENEMVLNRLAELRDAFNIRIGLTTTGHNQLEVLKRAVEVQVHKKPLFDVFQVTYNILDQSVGDTIHALQKAGNRIIIKEGMANGRFFPNEAYPHYQPLYDMLKQLADKYQVGIDAIALRFCMQTVEPFKVLSGASETQHFYENAKALDFVLQKDELEILKSFRIQPIEYWTERKQLRWN